MPKILVIGANGQLGNELKEFAKKNLDIEHFDHSFTFIDIEDLDLTNNEIVVNYLSKNSFDWIIN